MLPLLRCSVGVCLTPHSQVQHVPTPLDITSAVLDKIDLFAQYSAAAYCSSNIESTSTTLTCSVGNCPLVEAAGATTIDEFDEYAPPQSPRP